MDIRDIIGIMILEELKKRGISLKNLLLYKTFKEELGCDYILNPETEELHSAQLPIGKFIGPDNLHGEAKLERFIGLYDVGNIPVSELTNGTPVDIIDLNTGAQIGEYILNKCAVCYGKE